MRLHLLRRLSLAVPALVIAAALIAPGAVGAITDSDHDTLPNSWEVSFSHTNPYRADTDGDGLLDRSEDPDHDGLINIQEYIAGMNPLRADSDRDGIPDGREDTDGDGLRTAFEFLASTSPRRADTDGDGIRDGGESPDRDGLANTYEQKLGTNPKVADTDGDGWSDGAEWRAGTDARNASSHPSTTPAGAFTVPASINRTCATNVSPALNTWIAGRPNGSTLVFPSGSCYLLGGDAGINLKGRTGLTLVGTGSTLQLRTTGATNFSSGFFLQDSDHIIIRGFTVDGGNTATGTTGAAAAVNEHINGAMVRAGSNFVEFDHVTFNRLHGFGIFLIDDGRPGDWPSDVSIHNSVIRGGEMGIAIVAARRVNIVHNSINDTVYTAIDLEPDQAQHGFQDVRIADNDVTRYSWGQNLTSWFVAACPADAVVGSVVMDGLTITGNRVHTGAATANNGNYDGLGGLGIRADKSNLKRNVVITNNTTTDNDTQSASRGVIYLAHVANLTVTGNRQPIANGAALVRDSGTTGTRVVSGNNIAP